MSDKYEVISAPRELILGTVRFADGYMLRNDLSAQMPMRQARDLSEAMDERDRQNKRPGSESTGRKREIRRLTKNGQTD